MSKTSYGKCRFPSVNWEFRKNQTFKFLGILCFSLLIKNLFFLKSVQPSGYIINIYSMFPFTFYLFFIACYIISSFLIINNYKKLGILIICFNYLEILLIPYMLGYYSMGRADEMQYIGEYLQIAKSSHTANWDLYPASHIIGTSILQLSNIEAHYVSFIIPIVFSFIFIIGINLFSRELISDSFICSLVLVSSFILYLGVYNFSNAPHALFFAFMPLYLCYLHKYNLNYKNTSLSVIFVLLTLLIPITHPFIFFFLFSVFLLHTIPLIFSNSRLNKITIPKIKVFSYILLVLSFLSWFIYSETLTNDLKKSYFAYMNKITQPVIFKTSSKLSVVHFNFFDYLQLISFFYGRYVIPTIFIIICFILVYYNRKFLNTTFVNKYSYIVILYFTFIFIEMVLYFNPIFAHQPDRLANLNFMVYAQIPLFSYALYFIFFKNSTKFIKIIQVCGILTFIWSLSLFGCFDSPNVYKPNAALTYNEVEGMNWFYQVKDNSNVCVPLSQINRFHDLFSTPNRYDVINYLPDHFGYVNNSDTFKNINVYNGDTAYVVILTIDELVYQKVPGYMTVGRYTGSDFQRFKQDISLNKIYNSKNIDIFKTI